MAILYLLYLYSNLLSSSLTSFCGQCIGLVFKGRRFDSHPDQANFYQHHKHPDGPMYPIKMLNYSYTKKQTIKNFIYSC